MTKKELSKDTENTVEATENTTNSEKKKGGNRTLLIVLGCFGFLLLTCCALFFIGAIAGFNEAKKNADEVQEEFDEMQNEIEQAVEETEDVSDFEITLRPVDSDEYEKLVNVDAEYCDLVEGLTTYFKDEGDEYTSIIVSNSYLKMNHSEVMDYVDAGAYIRRDSEVGYLTDQFDTGGLDAFSISCFGGAMHNYLGELDISHPDADYTRSVVLIGGHQTATYKLSETNITITVYGIIDENILSINRFYKADELFLEAEVSDCLVMEGPYEPDDYVDFECLVEAYNDNYGPKERAQELAEELVSDVRLEE
jgi:hypothetical protein